jgi:hypothetical protein
MSDWLQEVSLFFQNVFLGHWIALATGGIVTGIIGVYEKKKQKSLSWERYVFVYFIFAILSVFQAWQDQYHSAQATQTRIDALAKPSLGGELTNGVLVARSGPLNSGVLATAKATIWNTAAPSIAKDFVMFAKLSDGSIIKAHTVFQPRPGYKMNLRMSDPSKPQFSYDGAEAIERQASASPIPTNGQVSGYFQGFFSEMSEEKLKAAQYGLTFVDMRKNKYTISENHTNQADAPPPVAAYGLQEQGKE